MDVAIIGAACLLPGATTLDQLHRDLLDGTRRFGPPGPHRLRDAPAGDHGRFRRMAYLDRIDLFDHRFFGLSRSEAELMDPHQRLTLQLVHTAMEHACHAPSSLRGSRTSVALSPPNAGYERLVTGFDPQQMLGLLPAATAARVSYLFDLTGPAMVVDTACSSALAAVATAVDQLRRGQADLAIAGGLSVHAVPPSRDLVVDEIDSADESCLPFDAAANGTVGGEGGGIVVLRPLADALADGDSVLAVIKGMAVNHNGFRAPSMGAPSAAAQAAMIVEAWQDAGVDPTTIGYVECHGSGTRLGDVVEVDGLVQAFTGAGLEPGRCTLGSVKAAIGHLDNAAGIAGLLKVVCGLRHGVRYPSPGFTTPNPMIDFGPLAVGARAEPWPGTPRRGAVTSLGFTGTNVHLVLEQAPPGPSATEPVPRPVAELVTVSARTATALAACRDALSDFVADGEPGPAEIAHMLNRGRDDGPFRIAFTAADRGQLLESLRAEPAPREPATARPLVLLFGGDARLDDDAWRELTDAYPELVEDAGKLGPQPAVTTLARQHACFRLLGRLGLSVAGLAGAGAGNLAVDLARGLRSPADAAAAVAEAGRPAPDPRGLRQALRTWSNAGSVLVELGTGSTLAAEITRLRPDLTLLRLPGAGGVPALLAQLYRLGVTIDWDTYYEGRPVRRVEGPGTVFEPVRCWAGEPVTPAAPPLTAPDTAADTAPDAAPDAVPAGGAKGTAARLAAVWAQVLKEPEVGPASDYFELGGNSISGMTVLRRIESEFGVRLGFLDLYEHRTIGALAAAVDTAIAGASALTRPDVGREVVPISRDEPLPLSPGQQQLWFLHQIYPDSPLYNVPADLRLRGPLDLAAFETALRGVVQRHEILRTRIVEGDDGEPRGVPGPADFPLDLVDLSGMAAAERDREASRLVRAAAVARIDLTRGPLGPVSLVRLAEDDHLFLFPVHHLAYDGGSSVGFGTDLNELYASIVEDRPARLSRLPFQFADFAAWQRDWLTSPAAATKREHWRELLAGAPVLDLPLDRPRPVERTDRGDVVRCAVGAELTARIRAHARSRGATTFAVMLAAVATLLHRWTGEQDLVIGTPTTGRVLPGAEHLVGYFNNVLPLRLAVHSGQPFDEVLRHCVAQAASLLDNEDIPFETIVRDADVRRDPGRNPLYDVVYMHQNSPSVTPTLPGVTTTRYGDDGVHGVAPQTAKFDLTIGVNDYPDIPMELFVEYSVDLFEPATVRALLEQFRDLLDAASIRPHTPLGELPEIAPRRPAATVGAILAKIWGELLEVDTVRPDDNFFKIGGDSLLSIRVVSRAAREGLRLRPQDLMLHQTLAELVEFVERGGSGVAGPGAAQTGPTPLTPLQHHFMARLRSRDRWAPGLAMQAPHGATLDGVRRAVAHLVARHEVLRSRFRADGHGRRVLFAAAEVRELVDQVGLEPMPEPDEVAFLHEQHRLLVEELDLTHGPVLRGRLMRRDDGSGLLLLVVSHFVLDNKSGITLVDDLDEAWTAITAGAPLPEPVGDLSAWRRWAHTMSEAATSAELAAELPYWADLARSGAATDQADPLPAPAGRVQFLERHLEPDAVPAALRGAGSAEADTFEAALCAAAVAVARWRGQDRAYLLLSGEPSRTAFGALDRALAAGWFSCMYPATLPVRPELAARESLTAVAAGVRATPGDGVGYGMLRHLAPPGPAVEAFRALPEPRILFQYEAADPASMRSGARHFVPLRCTPVADQNVLGEMGYLIIAMQMFERGFRVVLHCPLELSADRLQSLMDHVLGALEEL